MKKYKVDLINRSRFVGEVEAKDEKEAIEIMQRIVGNRFTKRYDQFTLGPIVKVEEL
jgi:hypothetical protein